MNIDNNPGEKLYKQALEEAKNDPHIFGLFLVAGRGKGFATEHSDYDGSFCDEWTSKII